MSAGHFPGCHPEDAQASERGKYQGGQPEDCWHCGTPTSQGCNCLECSGDSADYIPTTAIFHCRACGRYWAYMSLRVTTLTFGAES
jgi:ribosomal protein S14